MFASVQINTMMAMSSPVVSFFSQSDGLVSLSVAFVISALSTTLIWFRWKTRPTVDSPVERVKRPIGQLVRRSPVRS